ncbi:MAG: hypothetical protein SFT93_01035 [Rickettsiaceae bacterium]|nr:hypothetical protein [Rickettsiaceae bacterium]
MFGAKKKSAIFCQNSHNFVPFACHIDANTVLTKNGELLKTIEIKGIDLEYISKDLALLRHYAREAINKYLTNPNLAFWVHTVRRRSSLVDTDHYPTVASKKIHDIWVQKNFWNDKFVNRLYITILHIGSDISLKDKSWLSAFFNYKTFTKKHNEELLKAKGEIDQVTLAIYKHLEKFRPKILGIYDKDETLKTSVSIEQTNHEQPKSSPRPQESNLYCSISSLYRTMLTGIDKEIPVSRADISRLIGDFKYAVGSDKLEMDSDNIKKYSALLSIKKYSDISPQKLDTILQIPSEMVITESFYHEEKDKVLKSIDFQKYISNLSGDKGLLQSTRVEEIDKLNSLQLPYYNRQITILLQNLTIEGLDSSCELVGHSLEQVGINHIREDINLEDAFWSQMPGNFIYLKKTYFAHIAEVCAFASLHTTNIGSPVNTWGQYVTLLRTYKGTPFFFNFHSDQQNAKTFIIGERESGRTTISNFFISEAMKFNPAVLIIMYNNDSSVFTLANGGRICKPFRIDPFKILAKQADESFISDIIKAMCGIGAKKLSDEENETLDKLVKYLFSFEEQSRTFANIAKFEFSGFAGESLRARLIDYLPEGKFYEFFQDDQRWQDEHFDFMSIDFTELSNEYYASKHYPQEEIMLNDYYEQLDKFATFREVVLTLNIIIFLSSYKQERQIIKIEEYNLLSNCAFSEEFYTKFFNSLSDENIIYFNTITFEFQSKFFSSYLWKIINESFGTKMYLSAESVTHEWKEALTLDENEYLALRSIIVSTRLFMIKQNGKYIICELSIGGFRGIISILSSGDSAIAKFQELLKKNSSDLLKTTDEYYDAMNILI